MKHARQKIREAVALILDSIPAEVYTSRVYPIVTLPVVSVFANRETSESENDTIGAPRRYTRRLSIDIAVTVEAVTDADDEMDDLSAQVEALMAADVTFSDAVTDSELTGTSITMDGSSDTPVAIATLTYLIWYRTTGTDPEAPL